jgi:hypothetical protein
MTSQKRTGAITDAPPLVQSSVFYFENCPDFITARSAGYVMT